MDSSVVWLILIALVAIGLCWLLNRSEPRRSSSSTSAPRADSYGLSGAAGIGSAGSNCDTGQAGGGDCGSGSN